MCTEFDRVEILHILRTQNQKTDSLSKLAVGGDLNKDQFVVVLKGPKLERLDRHRI
jgi:hypothetical protein